MNRKYIFSKLLDLRGSFLHVICLEYLCTGFHLCLWPDNLPSCYTWRSGCEWSHQCWLFQPTLSSQWMDQMPSWLPRLGSNRPTSERDTNRDWGKETLTQQWSFQCWRFKHILLHSVMMKQRNVSELVSTLMVGEA